MATPLPSFRRPNYYNDEEFLAHLRSFYGEDFNPYIFLKNWVEKKFNARAALALMWGYPRFTDLNTLLDKVFTHVSKMLGFRPDPEVYRPFPDEQLRDFCKGLVVKYPNGYFHDLAAKYLDFYNRWSIFHHRGHWEAEKYMFGLPKNAGWEEYHELYAELRHRLIEYNQLVVIETEPLREEDESYNGPYVRVEGDSKYLGFQYNGSFDSEIEFVLSSKQYHREWWWHGYIPWELAQAGLADLLGEFEFGEFVPPLWAEARRKVVADYFNLSHEASWEEIYEKARARVRLVGVKPY